MKEKLKYWMGKKSFHISIIIIIVIILLFIVGVTILKYNVEGETNMPFVLTKIAIISSTEGMDQQPEEGNKWAFSIHQNNDIYLYLDKNENYKKQEVLDQIRIENIQVQKKNQKGTIKWYQPDGITENTIFQNKQENEIQSICYQGGLTSDLKQLKIANQGGIVAFRCTNYEVAHYQSNEDVVNHNELLKKVGVTKEDLELTVQFDFIMQLVSDKQFKTTISLSLPANEVIDQGVTSTEITDLKDSIFKRI